MGSPTPPGEQHRVTLFNEIKTKHFYTSMFAAGRGRQDSSQKVLESSCLGQNPCSITC